MASAMVKLAFVYATICVSHGSFDAISHDVLSFKTTFCFMVLEHTLAMVQIVKKLAFILVAVWFHVFSLAVPSTLLPLAIVDPFLSSVDELSRTMWLSTVGTDGTSVLAIHDCQTANRNNVGVIVWNTGKTGKMKRRG
jgi:hypothetical protein